MREDTESETPVKSKTLPDEVSSVLKSQYDSFVGVVVGSLAKNGGKFTIVNAFLLIKIAMEFVETLRVNAATLTGAEKSATCSRLILLIIDDLDKKDLITDQAASLIKSLIDNELGSIVIYQLVVLASKLGIKINEGVKKLKEKCIKGCT